MAININTVYESVRDLTLKDLSSGFLSMQQFDTYSNMAVVELFNKYSAIYQQEQRVTDKIRPFIKTSRLGVESNGHMDYPTDYVTSIAVRAYEPVSLKAEIDRAYAAEENPNYGVVEQIKVDVIDNDELGDRLSSSMLKPSLEYPIITFYDTYVQWHPTNIGSGFFEYLRQPVDVHWGFTEAPNGLPVYNPLTSVNFEFNWILRNELIIKICNYFGISVRESDLIQTTNMAEANQK